MRHVVFAVLATCWLATRAGAQTPEPVRDEPKPHGEPVKDPQPHGEPIHDGPHGEPVPPSDAEPPKTNPPNPDAPKTEPPKTDAPNNQPPNHQPPNNQPPKNQQPPKNPQNATPKDQTPAGKGTSQPTTPPAATPPKIPAGNAAKPPPPQPLPLDQPPPPNSIGSSVTTVGPQEIGGGDIPITGAEIRQITVEDNKKTTSDTVILIAQLEVGDTWTPDMVDVVKQRLVSSGLFRDVEVYYTKTDGGVAVHILARDKHSWVIAPAFYTQPTNIGGGIGFGENNLFGENQKLLLYAQLATGDSFFIGAWLVPSIAGTRLYSQLDTYLKSSRNIEYTAPHEILLEKGDIHAVRESRMHYLNVGGKLGVEMWRGVKLDARLRAAKVSYPTVRTSSTALAMDFPMGTDLTAPPKPGGEGADISTEWTLTIDRRANWYGIYTGHKYTFSYEHSLPSLGSDFDYWLAGIGLYKAIKVLEHHNLVLKGQFGYGHNLPFQQEYAMGGTSQRGWINNEFRGNLRGLTNVEYSVPFFTIQGFSVRGLAFWDCGYTTFTRTDDVGAKRNYLAKAEVYGLDGLKNSVGVGTRFYLRQIVLPLLGLDFGYGLEARDFQVYLAIGLTD